MAHIRAAAGLTPPQVEALCAGTGSGTAPVACDDSEMRRPVSYGDPEQEVRAVAVAMESTPRALRQAMDWGCDLFIAHHETFGFPEDTFAAHAAEPMAVAKKTVLDASGMTVLRVHGTWDLMPQIGVFDTWIRLLGYADCRWEPCRPVPKWEPWIRQAVFMKKLHIPPLSLGELAERVARAIAPYGQNGVPLVGDPRRLVRTLGVGDGGITDAASYHASGCDAGIVTSFPGGWWTEVLDGMGLLYVEHTVSELPGMENLARFLSDTLPELTVRYIDNGCPFRIVVAPPLDV